MTAAHQTGIASRGTAPHAARRPGIQMSKAYKAYIPHPLACVRARCGANFGNFRRSNHRVTANIREHSQRMAVVCQDKERVMKTARFAAALLTLAASACAYAPPRSVPLPAPPPPPAAADIHALVTANPDAVRILAAIRSRGLALVPSDVSRVDLLAGSPGYAWRVGPRGHLHLHSYRDREWAAAGARRFVATAMARSQIIDWAGKPHLFQCGTVVALYLGEAPQALGVIAYLCGPPVWMR